MVILKKKYPYSHPLNSLMTYVALAKYESTKTNKDRQ